MSVLSEAFQAFSEVGKVWVFGTERFLGLQG